MCTNTHKLLAAIEQFQDLIPEVIDNVNSLPDRIMEIDAITGRIKTITVEKYVYEPETLEDAWYPLHVSIFHYITDSIYHLEDFYFEIQETGIPESYGEAIK